MPDLETGSLSGFCLTRSSVWNSLKRVRLTYFERIGQERSSVARRYHRHKDCVEISFLLSGTGEYTIENRRYIAEKGDCVVINAEEVHGSRVFENSQIQVSQSAVL